ncbi:nucleoside-diphosphate sugar epimerase/dehydratase [Verrucomicrobiales bacterium BCK34]|nr:nucleoside-diphosphate sugar epimerase/dehydratase [Verrucomicrobiales bacterium BCK34]
MVLSFFLAIQLRFDFDVPPGSKGVFREQVGWIVLGFFLAILIFRLYRGLWRFFTLRDCFITALAIVLGSCLAIVFVYFGNGRTFEGFPRSTLIVTAVLFLFWEVGWRGLIRLFREHRIQRRSGVAGDGVLLMGSPDHADALMRNLMVHSDGIGPVVGLVSNNAKHRGQQIRGVRIYSPEQDLSTIVRENRVSSILFLPPMNSPTTIRMVVDALAEDELKCDYRVIPSMEDLASGKVSVEQIRKVSISDLLHRASHEIDMAAVKSTIAGRKIMVTGAGGSIGSEICRQIVSLKPASLTMFEASEYLLFEIEREIAPIAEAAGVRLFAVTGDVRRCQQVSSALRITNGVNVLYHAAAYKHVHLMEKNVIACFQNNVLGTQAVASEAEEWGVEDFVLVSTDKAVRPTSLMGASKRLAERVIMERPIGKTRFKSVRFGNVLGSSGSVIPIFEKQIAKGGPVTVTTKKVTRYFMTIPEAVELVIAASAVTSDRRICVLEMGEPVKIDSLARRMIELSGFVPDVDIKVEYVGLKPGEKEYEELLTDDEGVERTDHDRIWVVKKNDDQVTGAPVDIGELIELIDMGDEAGLRQYAHDRIPGSLLYKDLDAPA